MTSTAPPAAANRGTDRPSLIDVFENYLGTEISCLTDRNLEALTERQASELVDQIDIFLEAACDDEFADDAITLDGFASPIILPNDRSIPHTTRRAKQVALVHGEVVFPLEEFSLNYRTHGRRHLTSLCNWLATNELLLRSHVFSLTRVPELLDVLDSERLVDLADELLQILISGIADADLDAILPNWRAMSRQDLVRTISPLVYTTLQDAAAGSVFGTDLSFTQEKGGRLYTFLAEKLQSVSRTESPLFAHARLLHNLALPAINNLADADFVSIRLQSEDFDQFRAVLRRALQKTKQQMEAGSELDTAFHGSLDEVRWQAELLRQDTRDKHLAKFLRSTVQNVAIGSLVSTVAAAAGAPPQSNEDLQLLAARFGVSATLGTLFALLFYKPPKRKQRLLRFYDVLLDESSP
jgi:hypothetical protein